jgi:NADH-quinone oxidoreductase subunit H
MLAWRARLSDARWTLDTVGSHGSRRISSIIGFTFFMLINASALLVLAERKIMGFMQQRYGPIWWAARAAAAARRHPQAPVQGGAAAQGRRQVAVHAGADLCVTAAFAAFSTVPVGRGDDVLRSARSAGEARRHRRQRRHPGDLCDHLDGRVRIVLAGWSSNSKYSLFGGLRAAAQMISYELSYATALAGGHHAAGSLSLREVVDAQSGYWLGFIPSGTSSCSRLVSSST